MKAIFRKLIYYNYKLQDLCRRNATSLLPLI
jgi:hypothetical protein